MNKNRKNVERLSLETAVLMIIDLQEKLIPMIENRETIIKNTNILLDGAHALQLKTVITEQYPKGLGTTIDELHVDKENVELWEKLSFSVYEDCKDRIDALMVEGKKQFMIAGTETHVCVYQTVKDLLNGGADVYLIYDATGSRNILNHREALDTMRQLGAYVLPTESVLFELLKTSQHPVFKEVSKIIK